MPSAGITRLLLDTAVEPFLLASVVKSFIAQRLVRTICPDCVQWVEYPHEYPAKIGFRAKELGSRFRRPMPSDFSSFRMTPRCVKTSYVYMMTNRSRVVLYMGVTNSLERRLWFHGADAESKVGRFGRKAIRELW
jgi:type II secretory ATPase GspE/PulE/Tfp pilus assembly ATPase PilB-like protein